MTEALTWKPYIRSIVDSTQVRASVTNNPLYDLFQNQVYLKAYLDNMTPGKALTVPDQTLDSLVVVGTPVYLDTLGVWRPALAELSSDANSTLFTLTSKAFVSGIVISKNSAGKGEVAIAGQITLPAAFSSVIEGTFTQGLVYLSPYTAGKVTSSKGVAPVRVGLVYGPDSSTGTYRMLINPDQKVQLESHGHYRFDLLDAPAGDPNCVPGKSGFMWGDLEPEGPYPGVVHVVDNADSDLPGWLPVTDPIFDGLTIPAGAKFGYNISQDAALSAVWPPLPLGHVVVDIDGIDEVDDLVEVNSDGIWWMDDTYGKAPWPVNLPCPLTTSSSSATPYPIWPIRIELWFTKILNGSTVEALANQINIVAAAVQSLTPVAVGSNFVPYVSGGVVDYRIGDVSGSSSSAPGVVEPNVLMYQLTAKDFLMPGPTGNKFIVEVIVGGVSGFASTATSIVEGLQLTTTRVPAAAAGDIDTLTTVSAVEAWDVTPTTPATVPDGKYFVLRTGELTIDPGETIYLELNWSPFGLTLATDMISIFAVRTLSA